MSIESWRKEFLPVQVSDIPIEQAAEASLKKWLGFRKENVSKHKDPDESNGDFLDTLISQGYASSGTCQLCYHFIEVKPHCAACPLAIVRSGAACDHEMPGLEDDSPFTKFVGVIPPDPEPMIKWLKKAVKFSKKHLPQK